ncbi:MAG: metabolite traffic protein EboE [Verrucomicrobiae bacterium]|nr:metabolite traffic protein EboE [Verrucomicrobiae bacterium]
MKLTHGHHLAYCTNIHRGESWEDVQAALRRHTLAVRDRVGKAGVPFAIGLRLSDRASRELADPGALDEFRRWLDREGCYVFTINGFPYGAFHGTRVKEQVYAPDWTTPERLAYTNRLFDVLAALLPEGVEGSVSTVPVSFKGFHLDGRARQAARDNLWRCIEHQEQVTRRSGRKLHLGLEPEPFCTLETSLETVAFFAEMRADRPGDLRLREHLGVNYDCCHLAVEYEMADEALGRLRQHDIRISKIHLSSALRVWPTAETREALRAFADETYFHQVIERGEDGTLRRWVDLPHALAEHEERPGPARAEWRIHFHVPLHLGDGPLWGSTRDHVLGTLDWLKAHPDACRHLEMETYTWEVLPAELKSRSVVDQLTEEYAWTLAACRVRGLAAG